MLSQSRRSYLGVFIAKFLGLSGQAQCNSQPVTKRASIRASVDSAPTLSLDLADPQNYVRVGDGKLILSGKPFVIRGTNYFGSWLHDDTDKQAEGVERLNLWAFYHEQDTNKLDTDFEFMYSQLRATAVRTGTPSLLNFTDPDQNNDYEPWLN